MSGSTVALARLLADAAAGHRPGDAEALALLPGTPADALLASAEALTLEGYGRDLSWSRKVFVPLTRLCRDVCRYCTFAAVPGDVPKAYLDLDEVLDDCPVRRRRRLP